MSVSGKRRCATGHHVTKPATIQGVSGHVCKRCGCFLLTLPMNAHGESEARHG